jgi:hypothetical protein
LTHLGQNIEYPIVHPKKAQQEEELFDKMMIIFNTSGSKCPRRWPAWPDRRAACDEPEAKQLDKRSGAMITDKQKTMEKEKREV